MDMSMAAHSAAAGVILVTNDRDFYNIKRLPTLTDWALPRHAS